jgi:hypothetical protein
MGVFSRAPISRKHVKPQALRLADFVLVTAHATEMLPLPSLRT